MDKSLCFSIFLSSLIICKFQVYTDSQYLIQNFSRNIIPSLYSILFKTKKFCLIGVFQFHIRIYCKTSTSFFHEVTLICYAFPEKKRIIVKR